MLTASTRNLLATMTPHAGKKFKFIEMRVVFGTVAYLMLDIMGIGPDPFALVLGSAVCTGLHPVRIPVDPRSTFYEGFGAT